MKQHQLTRTSSPYKRLYFFSSPVATRAQRYYFDFVCAIVQVKQHSSCTSSTHGVERAGNHLVSPWTSGRACISLISLCIACKQHYAHTYTHKVKHQRQPVYTRTRTRQRLRSPSLFSIRGYFTTRWLCILSLGYILTHLPALCSLSFSLCLLFCVSHRQAIIPHLLVLGLLLVLLLLLPLSVPSLTSQRLINWSSICSVRSCVNFILFSLTFFSSSMTTDSYNLPFTVSLSWLVTLSKVPLLDYVLSPSCPLSFSPHQQNNLLHSLIGKSKRTWEMI